MAACPSGDVFHESCIQKWIASRGQCCTCKQRFSQQQLVTLKLPHNDTAAITAPIRKPTTAPSTPVSSTTHTTLASLSSPASPTLPPKGSPLSLANVEELIASYRRTANSYQQNRMMLQGKLTGKLQQLQLAYSRVVSDSTTAMFDSVEDADEALMHRHMLMAKLLTCVHEARLRDEEDSLDEMARVVRRVTGDGVAEEESVAEVVRAMEVLMADVDAQCWERIRTKRQQLADMEDEMRREEHEKQQWAQRTAALEKRRQQLEDSMHDTAQTRKRRHSPSVSSPFAERITAAVRSHLELSRPSHMSPSKLIMRGGSDDDDDDSQQHTSPPLSATSASGSASKRRKGQPNPSLLPTPQLTTEQFDALTDSQKLQLPRITILTHCPTIESFLSHELHLRTLKRRWPDNEWRKINTTYTGQRKRKGLKGRGRGRQVLPATEEEQQVWKDVRMREIALLMGGAVEGGGEGGGATGDGVGGGGGGSGSGSRSMEEDEDDDDDDRSEDEASGGNEDNERSEDSERSEASKASEVHLPVGKGHAHVIAGEHPSIMQAA